MSKFPSRRRAWALAYGLSIVAAVPLFLIQQVSSSPLPEQREGMIHLKRGQDHVDVNSLLDTNQPDFFLRIEMDKPTPAPSPSAEVKVPVAQTAGATLSVAAHPSPTPEPTPTPRQEPYESFLLSEEDEPFPLPSEPAEVKASRKLAETGAPAGERTQIVADALYNAPRLARQGRYRQALEIVNAALGVDDTVAPLHALRGSLCFKLGRERQAEEDWARALELVPRLSDAREALNWLRNRRR